MLPVASVFGGPVYSSVYRLDVCVSGEAVPPCGAVAAAAGARDLRIQTSAVSPSIELWREEKYVLCIEIYMKLHICSHGVVFFYLHLRSSVYLRRSCSWMV